MRGRAWDSGVEWHTGVWDGRRALDLDPWPAPLVKTAVIKRSRKNGVKLVANGSEKKKVGVLCLAPTLLR